MSHSPYKMIAIDMDGTLLSPLGQVTPRTKEAIHAALEAGLLVCFATGRNWSESQTVLEAVAHYDTAVFVGGAMVVDTKQRVTLHRTMMESQLAREICEVMEAAGHAVLALQDTHVAGVDYLITGELEMNTETRRWMTLTKAKLGFVPRLAKHDHPHTVRLSIVAPPEEVLKVKLELERRFGERIFGLAIAVPQAGVEVYEIFDPAVNKWEGIMHVARRHNIGPEQIIAIGDDLNDVPMISRAGLGVAMGNAKLAVKEVAKRVIGSNAEEGLAVFLEELVREHEVEPVAPIGS
jgi:Cof subfamily protein (haloacid dehalogenase superfamily)